MTQQSQAEISTLLRVILKQQLRKLQHVTSQCAAKQRHLFGTFTVFYAFKSPYVTINIHIQIVLFTFIFAILLLILSPLSSYDSQRKTSDILTSTLAAFLFSSHPKKERDREAHLIYYASAYNRGRQLSHRKTKQCQIRQKQACILN